MIKIKKFVVNCPHFFFKLPKISFSFKMQLRWGILSSGLISGDFVRSLKSLDPNHHKVVAIGSTRLESAKEFARKFNIPKAYGSYEELVKDKDIDVIYVSIKTILHFAAAKLCIKNRKHVLIEKPMTTW